MAGFQYPQSDRIVCNMRRGVLLQFQCLSFSIRNRIESSATNILRDSTTYTLFFQYPQSDRIVCNAIAFANPFTILHTGINCAFLQGIPKVWYN